jgi:hypothetical protein
MTRAHRELLAAEPVDRGDASDGCVLVQQPEDFAVVHDQRARSRRTLHGVHGDARVVGEHVDVASAADEATRVEVRLLREHAASVEHAVPAL